MLVGPGGVEPGAGALGLDEAEQGLAQLRLVRLEHRQVADRRSRGLPALASRYQVAVDHGRFEGPGDRLSSGVFVDAHDRTPGDEAGIGRLYA